MNSDLNAATSISVNSAAIMIDFDSEFSNFVVSIFVNLNSKISDFAGFEFSKSNSDCAVSDSVCLVSEFSVSTCADFDKSISVITLSDYVLL